MWILFRLAALAAGFFIRAVARSYSNTKWEESGGQRYRVTYAKRKGGGIIRTSVGVPFAQNWVFILTPESSLDRFFKRLGLSDEFQTGQAEFDSAVYVAGDHPSLGEALRLSQTARTAVLELMRLPGFRRLQSDGKNIWVSYQGNFAAFEALPALGRLTQELETRAQSTPMLGLTDPHFWKILAAESLVWGIGGYGIVGLIELIFHREDYHLNNGWVFLKGIALGVVGLGLALGLLTLLLRRSSRTHRVWIESLLILLLGSPLAGIQIFSDVNRGLDTSMPIPVDTTVTRYWSKEHRRKRSRYWTYHMEVDLPTYGLRRVEISEDFFQNLNRPHQPIVIELGLGRLGEPWFRGFRVK